MTYEKNQPITDHALENGKSYFELLFEQDGDSPTAQHHALDYPSKNKSTGDDANLSSTQSTKKNFAGDDNVFSSPQQQRGSQDTSQYPSNKNIPGNDSGFPSAQQQQQGPQNTTQYPSNKNIPGNDSGFSSAQQQQQQQQGPQNTTQYPSNKNIPGNDSGFPSAQQQQRGSQSTTQYPSNKNIPGDNEDADFDVDEGDEHKGKTRGQSIKDGVKNLVKSGVENVKSGVESLKSALPIHHDDTDAKRKASAESLEKSPTTAESSSLFDKVKNKLKGQDTPSNTTDDLKNTQPSPPPIPQGRFWQKPEDDGRS